MKINVKKLIALAITLLVLVMSGFAKDKENEAKESLRGKYLKSLTDFLIIQKKSSKVAILKKK